VRKVQRDHLLFRLTKRVLLFIGGQLRHFISATNNRLRRVSDFANPANPKWPESPRNHQGKREEYRAPNKPSRFSYWTKVQ